jgi:hypothetical protein
MPSRTSRASATLVAVLAVLLSSGQLAAQPAATEQPRPPFNPAALNLPASANALVREIIDVQLTEKPEPAYLFRLRRETPAGVQTKEIVETSEGKVALLLAINDQPLNEEQRQKEDARLEDFLKNPEEQAKQWRRQKEDRERTRKMLRAMPDAFIYAYDGIEPAPSHARPLVRLTFKPNPDFKPADRETQVFRGMEGHMLIDPQERHLVKIDAHLVHDVNFGWGIFGRLDKGGYFRVQQSQVSGSRWDISEMTLDFTGKVFLFKRLRIKEHQIASHFRPVPQNLSLQDGVRMLRQRVTEVAQKKQF